MRSRTIAILAALACAAAVRGDAVVDWNLVALDAIRNTGPDPGPTTRALALVNVAIFDIVAAAEGDHAPYQANVIAPLGLSLDAAIAAGAHDALLYAFPDQEQMLAARLEESLAAIPGGKPKEDGIALGREVARQLIAARDSDGWDLPGRYTPGADPGNWQPTWPGYKKPLGPSWGNVRPWTAPSLESFLPPPPPPLVSAEYAAAFEEVRQIGSLLSPLRTQEQTDIAWFWANDQFGTYKPPGHWITITLEIAALRQNTPAQNARLLALVSLAMADAGIACWRGKFEMDFWRPITGIQNAETDGNPLTLPDKQWEPFLVNPAFPAYASGHASFGAAAARTIALFYGTDEIHFTCGTDQDPTMFRRFESVWQAAQENAASRVYGGIHWSFDAVEGLALGAALGEHVIGAALLPLCPADCDADGALSISDFVCFQFRFAVGDARADCDASGLLTIEDFICFQARFAAGCP